MSFQVHPDPHHVQFASGGVLCIDCQAFTPGQDQERCLGTETEPGSGLYSGCGSNALVLVEKGDWHGGAPKQTNVHRVEVDCSTGMVGYTVMSKKDLEEFRKEQAEIAKPFEEWERKREARLAEMKALAAKDPGYKLLLQHQGILPED